mgnify:FL=1
MKDKLITYAFILIIVFALFAVSWPVFSNVVTTQVNKIDDNIPTVTIPSK